MLYGFLLQSRRLRKFGQFSISAISKCIQLRMIVMLISFARRGHTTGPLLRKRHWYNQSQFILANWSDFNWIASFKAKTRTEFVIYWRCTKKKRNYLIWYDYLIWIENCITHDCIYSLFSGYLKLIMNPIFDHIFDRNRDRHIDEYLQIIWHIFGNKESIKEQQHLNISKACILE